MSMIATATSKNGRAIRLMTERWFHISESHDYMAGYFYDVLETISNLDYVVAGKRDELLAVRFYKKTHIGSKHLVVIYKETNAAGFIITAFMTSKIDDILRRKILWQKR